MYWEVVNTPNFLNNVLHENLEVDPVIILIIPFFLFLEDSLTFY